MSFKEILVDILGEPDAKGIYIRLEGLDIKIVSVVDGEDGLELRKRRMGEIIGKAIKWYSRVACENSFSLYLEAWDGDYGQFYSRV